jgi:RNA polymerase sigma factor (sigma-70 family)
MNVRIHPRNLDLLKSHERLVERHASKIRKMLGTFSKDSMELDVTLEKLPRGSQFQTSLVLALPQQTIQVEDIQDNPTSSIVNAFDELKRRVKRFKSRLTRERLWRKEAVAPTPGGETPVAARPWDVESEANEHLDKVENYLRREIYHQVLLGTMPPGVIEAQALADEVFVEVTSGYRFKPDGLTMEQWMFQVARRILKERLEDLEAHRDEPHMEEELGAERRWEDEDFHFYQPDESLRLEDLLRDGQGANPEELLAHEETVDRLQRAVAGLAPELRESFVLFALEGFTSDEVAMMTGKTPAQVVSEVEQAREILRRDLKS